MLLALPIPESWKTHRIKTSVLNRVIAKFIDLAVVLVVGWVLPYPLGPFAGFAYSLLGDAMNFGPFRGQSVGKKLMKLQVIHIGRRRTILMRDSAYRNAPVGIATFFGIIPVWGWLILVLIGIPLMVMEVYLMLSVETGRRLGDVMGDTEVVEFHPTEKTTAGV